MELLFVCTGNICRSPIGERLTRAFAEESLGRHAGLLIAHSAGTDAVRGGAMNDRSAQVLRDLGGDPSGFVGRQFTADMAEQADLVLTLTRTHRRKVLKQAPQAMRRTFTVLEAADLFAQLPAGAVPRAGSVDNRGRALVAALADSRARRRVVGDPAQDDVPDPIGRSVEVHASSGAMIAEALSPMLHLIVGLRAPRRPVPALPQVG